MIKNLLFTVALIMPLFLFGQINTFPNTEDFESGSAGWTITGTTTSWAFGTPANAIINGAASGDSAWVTNLTGNYLPGENGAVESPVYDLSSTVCPSVSMNIWWNSENSWDGAVLQSSIDGGISWQNVGSFGDPDNWYNDNTINGNPGGQQIGWTGRNSTNNGSGGWVTAKNALTGLAGESNVKFRVAFGSDGSVHDEGFAFDDFTVFDPATDLSLVSLVGSTVLSSTDCGTLDTLTATVVNVGCVTIDGVSLAWSYDDGVTPIAGTMPVSNLLAGDTMFISFAVDWSASGSYSPTMNITVPGDVVATNDTIQNIGTFTSIGNSLDVSLVSLTGSTPLPGNGCGPLLDTLTATIINTGCVTIDGVSLAWSYDDGVTPIAGTMPVSNLLVGDTMFISFAVDWSVSGLYSPSMNITVPGDAISTNDTIQNIGSYTNRSYGLIVDYYWQDFENGPEGWSEVNNANGTWELATPAGTTIIGAASGVNAWVTNATGNYNGNDNSWVLGPCFDFSDMCNPYIELDIWWNSENSWDGAVLQSSVDEGITWQNVGLFGDPNNWYNDNTINGAPGGSQEGWTGSAGNGSGGWVTARHALVGLDSASSVSLRIAFGSDGAVHDEGFAFDNVHIYDGLHFLDDILPEQFTVCVGDTIQLDGKGNGTSLDTYAWSTNDSTQTISVSTAGDYVLTLTDPNGCIAIDTATVVVNSPPIANLGPDTIGCDMIMLDAGAADIYSWSTGDSTAMITVNTSDTIIVELTNIACPAVSDTVVVDINVPPSLSIVIANPLVCSYSTTGVLNAIDSGGTGAVTFQWDANANNQTAQSASGLTGGTYSVTATDAVGCTAVESFAFVAPDSIGVTPDNIQNVSCNGGSDGAIEITTYGGTGAYTYLWSNNATTEDLTGLAAGAYSGTITDANGCTFSATVPITEPTPLVASITDLGNGLAANANGSGGTAPYSFQWDANANNQTSQTASNLTAGETYSVTVTDANGCQDTASVTIAFSNIDNIEELGTFKVFPNPNNGEFVVQLDMNIGEDVAVYVYSVDGKIIYQKELGIVQGQINETLSLQDIPSGVYFVKARLGSHISTRKLIIKD